MEYYTIEVRYPAAKRGEVIRDDAGKMVMHIGYAVDEDAESRQLSYIEKVVHNAAKTAGLDVRHQHSWPDGSCYKWALVDTHEELASKLGRMQRILAAPWMETKPIWLTSHGPVDPTISNGHGVHLNLIERMRGNMLPLCEPEFECLEPRESWGGMKPSDWSRYRELTAFRDGFLEAFGHHTGNVWSGLPGYTPTERTLELAGAAYHLGLLFKLLNY